MENILLLGLGAIGSLVASKFTDNKVDVDILLDEERHERYSKNKYYINDIEYNFSYVTPKSYDKKADFVIIATKYNQLPNAIAQLDGLIAEDCTIMSLLNGIDSEEIIGKKLGADKLVYAFITGTDATRESNRNYFTADGIIYFGEKSGADSQRTKDIARLFDKIDMKYKLSDDIITKQWKKYMINIGMNQVSAVLNATYGDFMKSEEIITLTHKAMRETVSIAQKRGISLQEKDVLASTDFLSKFSPDGKTSMLQDVCAKRKTEVEMLAETLIKMGREHNVPTPINEVLYLQLKAIESMY
ncbi:MAG: ketopantoate reductase family protein [Eubacteriales bacterium]